MNGYLDMKLLRFTTAGSVDDGKSTLIGRLLYDSKSIFEDQIKAVERASERLGNKEINLALLTDGLRAEREQGITIDVAYRYFSTPKRKFIISDTPGHIEYTRNMVTGASTADVAIILVDARHGIVEQTKRHSYIASLLGLEAVVVAVNKMDLMDFSQKIFDYIKNEYEAIASKLNLKNVYYIPMSAYYGDNVVNPSEKMSWYEGDTLLGLLEKLPVKEAIGQLPMRFPVQYVIRPQDEKFHDYRAFAGRLASGTIKVGDQVTILPSLTQSTVKAIEDAGTSLEEASAPLSVAIRLNDEIDVSRGCMIVKSDELPHLKTELSMLVCWLNQVPMALDKKYIIRHTTDEVFGVIKEVDYKVNIKTLGTKTNDNVVRMNDLAQIRIKTAAPVKCDLYSSNRVTGSLVIIDAGTFETVGAGMIVGLK